MLLLACAAAAMGQTSGGRGVEIKDVDRNADPCTDFYEFANGAWRASNPIPPEMQRWSRRWQAGETSKDKLKGILEEVSAQKGAPVGSVKQQIGDFYSACMDEKAVNAAGPMPTPFLEAIFTAR